MTPSHAISVRRLADRWRWLPFTLAALGSNVVAASAPHGRREFAFDWSLSLDALQFSAAKGPHIGATALIGLLAVVATGRRRWPLAFLLTWLAAGLWEVGQTTVIGHTARLSDLAPDAIGALAGCAWGCCTAWLLQCGLDSLAPGGPPMRRAGP